MRSEHCVHAGVHAAWGMRENMLPTSSTCLHTSTTPLGFHSHAADQQHVLSHFHNSIAHRVPLWIATGSVFHAYEYYGRVRKAIGLQGKSTPPTGTSMHSKIVLVKQFIPFGIYLLLSLLWVFFPAPPAIWFGVGLDHPSSGNERPDLTAGAPFGTLACILLCYGYITCKLIVANVCGQEYSVWQVWGRGTYAG